MLLSMTGYGRASQNFGDKAISVEIKSLNGKTSDIRLKVPSNFKEKELEIRKLIMSGVARGKIEAIIMVDSKFGEEQYALNKELVLKYVEELNSLPIDVKGDYLQAILRIPNVVKSEISELQEDEWKVIKDLTLEALGQLKSFRKAEGDVTLKDFENSVGVIARLLEEISVFESARIEKLKERLRSRMDEFLTNDKVDPNRFEQEIIYYMEKLDINEEKVRLKQHCDYFLEVLRNEDEAKGKKLGFISQEMGREINTLGAKAQNADIQQKVVGMKDELERIKEQVLNII